MDELNAPLRPMGFIGLDLMGHPMAINLVRAGFATVVWNRTRSRCEPLAAAGASVASDAAEVFSGCRTVVLMLADEAAVDAVLDRRGAGFAALVADRTIVQTGTFAVDYSAKLAEEVAAAGGRYVEAPVSGSRGPGRDAPRAVGAPLCRGLRCGPCGAHRHGRPLPTITEESGVGASITHFVRVGGRRGRLGPS